MSLRLAACLLLFCACLPATAREVRLSGANGDGGHCPEHLPAGLEQAQAVRGDKRSLPAGAAREQPAASRGAEAEQSFRAPRWHSFLPGMFR